MTMSDGSRTFCSAHSRTVSTVWCTPTRARRYIMVGWNGRAWSSDEWATDGLPPGMDAAVSAVRNAHGVVVRLFDQRGTAAPGKARLLLYPEGREVPPVEIELLPQRLAKLAGQTAFLGSRLAPKALFVCIHGKRDACCAKFGYRLYRDLSDAAHSTSRDLQVFGSSHLGGDRFAPTLIALPSGHMYGHLDSQDVNPLLEAIEADLSYFPKYRGSAWVAGDDVFVDVALSAAKWKLRSATVAECVVQRRERDSVEVQVMGTRQSHAGSAPVAAVSFIRSKAWAYSSCKDANALRIGEFATWDVQFKLL